VRHRGPGGGVDAAGTVGLEVWWSFWGEEARQGVLLVASGLAARLAGKFGQGTRIGDECLDLCGEIPGRNLDLTGAGEGERARARSKGRRHPCRELQPSSTVVAVSVLCALRAFLGFSDPVAMERTTPDGGRPAGQIALLTQFGVFARDCARVMLLRG